MKIVGTLAEARALNAGVVGLVPTMGFFHEGHLSLMNRAVAECDMTVVSLFVNPLQFNVDSDFDRYPQDHDRDIASATDADIDVMVIPSLEEMYPDEPHTRVRVDVVADGLEGEHRPGHLTGVATVVAKLFAGLQPSRAYFGRKDAQQLAMVTTMSKDLSFPLEVVGCSLVRESDGLALSSRNVFLESDREEALGLSRGLFIAADLIESGERASSSIVDAVQEASPEIDYDYVAVTASETMVPVDHIDRVVVVSVAALVGSVRLIDNVSVSVAEGQAFVDRGVRLDHPSALYQVSQGGAS